MIKTRGRVFGILLTCLWFGGWARADSAPARPNIVFILADDLGSGDVGWRGGEIKTPNLDTLAMAGARLEQFYVQPVCTPTRAALMTGRYPMRHGLQTGVVRPWAQYGLPLEERTLPQALKEAGYETAICGKWHLGHFRPEYLPTRRGFDHQYGHYNGAIDYYTHDRDGGHDWHRNDKASRDEGYSTTLLAREAVRRIRERDKAKSLFLYVPFNAVHAPHQVPEEFTKPYAHLNGNRRIYAGMLSAMDKAVGEIISALDDEGLRKNTLIVFSSDNGGPNPARITSNGKLRAGKGTVYEGGVRVAAFAHWEGSLKPRAVNEPLHMVDWYPTLLKLTGARLEQKLPVDGLNIWPVLAEGNRSPHEAILINAAPDGGAIRVGDWKLVVTQSGQRGRRRQRQAAQASVELFNLATDPGEAENLALGNPEKVKSMLARYGALAAQAVPPKAAAKPPGFKSPAVWGEQ